MSSVSSVGNSAATVQLLSSGTTPKGRASDGDSPAKEAHESLATKIAEKQNGGFVPHSKGRLDKTA